MSRSGLMYTTGVLLFAYGAMLAAAGSLGAGATCCALAVGYVAFGLP